MNRSILVISLMKAATAVEQRELACLKTHEQLKDKNTEHALGIYRLAMVHRAAKQIYMAAYRLDSQRPNGRKR